MIQNEKQDTIRGSIIEFLESRFEETMESRMHNITNILYANIVCKNSRFFIVRKDDASKSFIIALNFDSELGSTLCLAFVFLYENVMVVYKIANASYNIHDMQNRIKSNRSLMSIFNNIDDVHNILIFMHQFFVGRITIVIRQFEIRFEFYDQQIGRTNNTIFYYRSRILNIQIGKDAFISHRLKMDDIFELKKSTRKHGNIKELLDAYCKKATKI